MPIFLIGTVITRVVTAIGTVLTSTTGKSDGNDKSR